MSREDFDKLPQAEKDKIMAEQRARQEARMDEHPRGTERSAPQRMRDEIPP